LLAAAAVARIIGLNEEELSRGLKEVKPFAGRMQILDGKKGSTIIDDTYNASPAAVIAALDVLYSVKATQRIAILGNMNELGGYSQQAHEEVGAYCRSDLLDLVVTIGADVEKYLVPVAKAKGCTVQSFASPYDAGAYVLTALQEGAVILAEGSQNRVFAEEAVKLLLENPADNGKLVRQSDDWLQIKQKQFSPSTEKSS
jgi:UDP-N-acetylmuramyl pentapeptide synthase